MHRLENDYHNNTVNTANISPVFVCLCGKNIKIYSVSKFSSTSATPLYIRSAEFIHLIAANLEKAMAAHSSTLAWKIPWTEEPGGLQSMWSQRVRHHWATSLSLFTFMHWRRKWQPTPVFLPGESQGRGSLVGCRLWGHRVRHDRSDLAAAA